MTCHDLVIIISEIVMSGYPGSGYPGAPGGYPGAPGAPGGYPPAPGAPGGYPPAGGYGGGPPVDPAVAEWFRAVDQDNSGQIDAKELGQVSPVWGLF